MSCVSTYGGYNIMVVNIKQWLIGDINTWGLIAFSHFIYFQHQIVCTEGSNKSNWHHTSGEQFYNMA